MEIDGDVLGVSQTIQHHPPAPQPPPLQQFSLLQLQTQTTGKIYKSQRIVQKYVFPVA